MAITTNTEYKVWAKIPAATTTWDALITSLILGASQMAEVICNRTQTDSGNTSWETGTYTELFNGEGVPSVKLRNTPITSVTSVTSTAGDGSTLRTWASTEYKYNPRSGVLELTPSGWGRFSRDEWGEVGGEETRTVIGVSPAFSEQFRNLTVVYVGGYTTAPYLLKRAIWKMVDLDFNSAGVGAIAKESIGNRSVEYARANAGDGLTTEKAIEILREVGAGMVL